ncbi:MAG: MlaD family protein, partial [Paraglaciecola sp.]
MNESVSSQPIKTVTKTKVSKVWLLPIVAVLIGAAMIYNNWQNRGIDIQVTFNTAEGLVAGKTKLKNREVEIGTVNAISFSKDKKSILVDIKVEREMQDFLVSDSQFWVVRPRIGPGGVSGISTLLSGAYIQVVPGSSDKFHQDFIGLERPLISVINTLGMHVNLVSSGGKSLRIGNPVIYRGFEVGKIEAY